MTNKEILQANLLDIVFENRNKDYGAYTLRRDYNHRMLVALGVAMSVILVFVLMNLPGKKNNPASDHGDSNKVVITTVEFPKDQPKEPEKPKDQPKPEPVAKVKDTPIIVVKDDKADKNIPTEEDIKDKEISTMNVEGRPADGIVKPKDGPVTNTGDDGIKEPVKPKVDFKPIEKDPEFPGGQVALQRFLATNLNTPEELNIGEKKTVKIRFKVGEDGVVSSFEIVISGGGGFDREVVRVCRKMPRWKPAIQNGVNVPVTYLLPVTFIGIEQ